MIKKILAATDASPASENAVDYALYLAKELGAKLFLIYVAELKEQMNACDLFLSGIKKKAAERGIECDIICAEGLAAPTILKVSEEKKIDLIVMGSHGRSTLGLIILGSVAYSVMQKSKIPVLIAH